MKRLIAATSILAMLTACADQQQKQPAYVSPLEFKGYNCKQIAKEMAYTSQQMNEAAQRNQGSEIVGAALAAYAMSQRYAFTTGGDDDQTAYLRAKYEALHQASVQKNCD
jgi:hypothetical protein